jgi:CRISPR/Cas system Type II protein with McrA/HNH and RuvC-like nuclease domain
MDFLHYLHKKQNRKCYYCANVLNLENNNNKTLDQISIDRKNSNIGHVMGNCVLTCLFCNSTKTDRSIEEYKLFLEFIRHPDKIHEHIIVPHKTWITPIFSNLKTKHPETDITREWIQEQFDRQNGRCFYTGIKMIITKENRYLFKPSMERIDCSKPYTRDNCVLVCLGSNLGRNDIELSEYLKFIESLRVKNV